MKKKILCLCVVGAMALVANAKVLNDSDFNAMKGALGESMNRMHKYMDASLMEKDPDLAFVVGMLPHHEGAVDMAKIVLKYGEDKEILKLAKNIIKAQEKEINFMKNYLEKKGYKYNTSCMNPHNNHK